MGIIIDLWRRKKLYWIGYKFIEAVTSNSYIYIYGVTYFVILFENW
jgi:hypothetical protein